MLLDRVTGSWTVKTLFSNTFFPCFSVPMGPCSNPGLLQPQAVASILQSRFSNKVPLLSLKLCPPELQACLSGGEGPPMLNLLLTTWTPRSVPTTTPPHPSKAHSSPLPYFIPEFWSHDRNKLARGSGHTLESSKAFCRKSIEKMGFSNCWSRRDHTLRAGCKPNKGACEMSSWEGRADPPDSIHLSTCTLDSHPHTWPCPPGSWHNAMWTWVKMNTGIQLVSVGVRISHLEKLSIGSIDLFQENHVLLPLIVKARKHYLEC